MHQNGAFVNSNGIFDTKKAPAGAFYQYLSGTPYSVS